MEHVNEGGTQTEKLLFYLEDYFDLENTDIDGQGLYDQISYLENHKGNWIIGFKGLPRMPLLISITALFETKMSYDGIEEIVFFHNSPNAVSVKEVAGCLGTRDGILRLMRAYEYLDELVGKKLLVK